MTTFPSDAPAHLTEDVRSALGQVLASAWPALAAAGEVAHAGSETLYHHLRERLGTGQHLLLCQERQGTVTQLWTLHPDTTRHQLWTLCLSLPSGEHVTLIVRHQSGPLPATPQDAQRLTGAEYEHLLLFEIGKE